MTDLATPDDLIRLLAWYRDMGCDAAVADAAVDWRARPQAGPGAAFVWPAAPKDWRREGGTPGPVDQAQRPGPSQKAPPPPPPHAADGSRATIDRDRATRPTGRIPPSIPPAIPPPRAIAAAPPDAIMLAARAAARGAKTLADLRAVLESFDGCDLKTTAKNLCFSRGADRARVMLIGEAPGHDEDAAGRPIVGAAGHLLDRMLAAIGLDESSVHIANIVYWRPPLNRTPTPQEAQACRPFLERQIELVAPEIIVLLGGAAAKHVLDSPEGIMRLRGAWRTLEIAGRPIRAIATLHPAYLLRTPSAKRQAWADMLAVKLACEGRGDPQP